VLPVALVAMATIPDSVRDFLAAGLWAHVVTMTRAGEPYVNLTWAGFDGDEIIMATFLYLQQRKLQNVRDDDRVALSFEGTEVQPPGLKQYLVVYGRATIEEGGAPELLQELAHVYLGPDVKFPPMDDPPPGVRLRISVDRVRGVGIT